MPRQGSGWKAADLSGGRHRKQMLAAQFSQSHNLCHKQARLICAHLSDGYKQVGHYPKLTWSILAAAVNRYGVVFDRRQSLASGRGDGKQAGKPQ